MNVEIKAYGYVGVVPVEYVIAQRMCEFRTEVTLYGRGVMNNTYNLLEKWRDKNVTSNLHTDN